MGRPSPSRGALRITTGLPSARRTATSKSASGGRPSSVVSAARSSIVIPMESTVGGVRAQARGGTRVVARLALVAAALTVSAGAACSGDGRGGEALTHEEFVARATEICSANDQRVVTIAQRLSGDAGV